MTEILAAANNLIVAAVSVIGAITAALLAGIAVWTFRDIRSRTRDILVQILATVMVAVIPIAGLIVYFLLRPRETLAEGYVRALEEESLLASIENQEFCPTCGRRVDGDMQFCPSCHDTLRRGCPNCGRALHLSWDLCPYCGTEVTPQVEVSKPARKTVAAPRPATAGRAVAAVTGRAPAPVAAPRERLGGLLNKLGGAVEGVVDRARNGAPVADAEDVADVEAVAAPAPRAMRRAMPRPNPPPPPVEDALE
ncbi:MAG: zinc ribbon domain-containing protein [Thermoflexales bacterium]|nr:zinc ribbon domain-containing protein [Thermoflexales bacterium]